MNGLERISFVCALLLFVWCYRANALQCLECTDMPRPDACRIVTTCSSGSQCYVEQVVSSGGLVLYNMGCLSSSQCSSGKRSLGNSSSLRKRQGTVSKTDIVTCVSCCNGDFCNIEGCGITALRQPNRPPLCFACPSQLDPVSCRDLTQCDSGHDCALIHTVTNQWKSTCVPTLQCQALSRQSSHLCYRCCQDDFCNNNCTTHHTSLITTSIPNTTLPEPMTSTLSIISPTKHQPTSLSTTVSTVTNVTHGRFTKTVGPTTLRTTLRNSVSTTISVSASPTAASFTKTTPTAASTSTITSTTATTKSPVVSSTASSTPSSTLYSATAQTTSPTSASFTKTTSTPASTSTITSTTATTKSPVVSSTASSISSSTLYPKTEPIAQTTSMTPSTTGGCLNRIFDICFVVDSSGSIGPDGFHRELQFIGELIKSISAETNTSTRFCVIAFSTRAYMGIGLSQYSTVAEILNAIGTIPYREIKMQFKFQQPTVYNQVRLHGCAGWSGSILMAKIFTTTGETETQQGIHKANTEFRHHGRFGSEKVIVLITDGKSNHPDKTIKEANHIKGEGVEIYAVNAGNQTNSNELGPVVTDRSHLFEVPDLNHLKMQNINIIPTFCRRPNA